MEVRWPNSAGSMLYTDKAYQDRLARHETLLAQRIYGKFIEAWALDKYRKNKP